MNYQSVMLARLLGTAPPPPTAANSGTSFYERTATGPGSPSIAKVNSVDVSTAAAVLGQAWLALVSRSAPLSRS